MQEVTTSGVSAGQAHTAFARWSCWRLSGPPPSSDVLAQLLLDVGCQGAQVEDCEVVLDESEDATFRPLGSVTVTGYLFGADDGAVSQALRAALQGIDLPIAIACGGVADEDWATSWRQNFPPLRVGQFLIVPSWEPGGSATRAGAITIQLDPGLAFGTGQHPTTHMCLEMLPQQLGQVSSRSSAASVLDLGCGSGVLSIAAALMGARVVASDLDQWCVRATRENAVTNEVTLNVVQAAGLTWLQGRFGLVVANLTSTLLLRLAPHLANAVQPGGRLLVSGMSLARADEVQEALTREDLLLRDRREMAGDQRGDYTERWAALAFVKGS